MTKTERIQSNETLPCNKAAEIQQSNQAELFPTLGFPTVPPSNDNNNPLDQQKEEIIDAVLQFRVSSMIFERTL